MGRVISITSSTVDGLVDVGDWFVGQGDHDDAALEQWRSSAAMLTGRPTYEGFLGFWPDQTGPWAEVLNPALRGGAWLAASDSGDGRSLPFDAAGEQ